MRKTEKDEENLEKVMYLSAESWCLNGLISSDWIIPSTSVFR